MQYYLLENIHSANLVKSISGKVPYIDIAPDELQKIKVWRVTDQGTISLITKNFNNSKIFIADGHHRYEAGLRYISKINKYREIDDNESINYRMIQLISMNEPGLVTRSYHRYIRFNENFSEYKEKIISDDFVQINQENFSYESIESLNALYETLNDTQETKGVSFGIIIKQGNTAKSFIYKNQNSLKNNDYSFLHEKYLKDKINEDLEDKISFETDLNEIMKELSKNENLIVFIMRPIPMKDFIETVKSGEVLPPKVTNFLPKPPAGLVFQDLDGDL